jgi:hypothetical protein
MFGRFRFGRIQVLYAVAVPARSRCILFWLGSAVVTYSCHCKSLHNSLPRRWQLHLPFDSSSTRTVYTAGQSSSVEPSSTACMQAKLYIVINIIWTTIGICRKRAWHTWLEASECIFVIFFSLSLSIRMLAKKGKGVLHDHTYNIIVYVDFFPYIFFYIYI